MILLNRWFKRIAAIEGITAEMQIRRFAHGGYRCETMTCGGWGRTPQAAVRNAVYNLERRRRARDAAFTNDRRAM